MEIQILDAFSSRFCYSVLIPLRIQKRVQSKSNPINARTRATQKKRASPKAAVGTRKPPQQKPSPHQRTQKRYYVEV
jgi:hypothetical protein